MKKSLGALLTMATVLFCLIPSPAQAAGELGLSWDGQSWAGKLNGSLFDSSALWVPGDAQTRSFYVRNQGSGPGRLKIAAQTKDGDRLLRNGDIVLTARVSGGPWVALKTNGESLRINPKALPQGAARRVDVRASFVWSSPNRSQRKKLALSFRVTMVDATAGAGGDGPGNGDGVGNGDGTGDGVGSGDVSGNDASNGLLGDTGAPSVGWLIVLAGIALGTGLALMRRRHGEGEGRAGTSR